MTDFSVLDLVPVREGGSVGDALAAATALARTAQDAGCKRFWVAEHHAMKGIAGGATSVVLAHIGNATSTIRIGSGGIMLPNHSPFQIAEQFGTLDALFPGRIDLGLGRAPGAGPELQRALRKDLHRAAEMFPQDVAELIALMAGETAVQPTPGVGAKPQFWMLGSSLFGAQLAAKLGLPYAFASHFAPDHLDTALELYRRDFQPSEACEKPHVMVAMNLFVADTEDEAEYLATSQLQAFVALRTGTPGKLPPPVRGYRASLPPQAQAMLAHIGQASATGTPQQAAEAVRAFIARTGADEVLFGGSMYDPEARCRSLRLAMEALAA
ncbi:MAG TPA: LLM class flavin-dependent oxidoreductase [Erythrobacter sp.]|jgi:luciferase family oxidoreductase group 1|uniref:Luciferase-like monooxygenase n=2 Tax=Qipengyuania citrea TaxID=225971 RepID=A0A6I4UAJ4_9SPHN|nr:MULTISPECIES: LLM class flavin-dependent oxidoreductase [Erythrobacteraceae]MBB11391.1 LLM class flavin-dependent oxidoreductase [Sphingomonadaceae bacterium]MCZ4264029.1 LLM class flavin-dependent oxidoreductase [Erythrobacter sp. G21629-S1]HAL90910.1 LLM class flavin-dependent oxidoreductase [Erythrobacter sp.]KNH00819.1 alkane 1-monooxygenase [Qipengyuania citrea LAMA 915]KZX92089.1 alkane 1-monooxygenase [Erythrobacter sp. HI0019]|tara:strand:+ start:487 stop:1464 length:978 start_codon:yes stop_codon:yes gene_type:complete